MPAKEKRSTAAIPLSLMSKVKVEADGLGLSSAQWIRVAVAEILLNPTRFSLEAYDLAKVKPVQGFEAMVAEVAKKHGLSLVDAAKFFQNPAAVEEVSK